MEEPKLFGILWIGILGIYSCYCQSFLNVTLNDRKEHLCWGIICLGIQPSTQFIVFSLYCLFSQWHSSKALGIAAISLKEGQLGALLLPAYDRAQADMR